MRDLPIALICATLLAACTASPPDERTEVSRETGETARLSPWEEARRRGVDFRAIGQEPGWVLEIREGRDLMFAGDYGETRVTISAPQRTEAAAGRVRYRGRSEGRELTVLIEQTRCQDIMSGEQFPARVTVQFEGREHHGCGQRLLP